MARAALSVRNLTKRFGAGSAAVTAVDGVSFDVAGGEFFTMLGPSGCGKTTTLRVIAGLDHATSGEIVVDGRDFMSVPPQRRNIGMVFQSYALFPHLTIFENVAYGLRLRGISETEIRRRVTQSLALLQLEPYAARYPGALSGGQQQRVSIARALVYEPTMLLLDEPLANLDAKLRVLMREEIRALQRRLGITTLYVTHDQVEATAVSDRIAVFNRGRLIQVGAPSTIYARPDTLFVADFIGRANFVPVVLCDATTPAAGATLADGTVVAPARRVQLETEESATTVAAGHGILMVRPEHLMLEAEADGVSCRVLRIQLLGGLIRYTVESAASAAPIHIETTRTVPGIVEGAAASFRIPAADAVLYHR